MQFKVQFLNQHREIDSDLDPELSHTGETVAQVEGTRQQLASTSQGLDFLIGEMRNIEGRAILYGRLSMEDGVLMLACCGFGNDTARSTFQFAIRTSNREPCEGDTKFFSTTMKALISSLSGRRVLVKRAEKLEAETQSGSAAKADTFDRFSRAETIYERRMYRALGMLLALRGPASRSMKEHELPE